MIISIKFIKVKQSGKDYFNVFNLFYLRIFTKRILLKTYLKILFKDVKVNSSNTY